MYQKDAEKYVMVCLEQGMDTEAIKDELVNAGYAPNAAQNLVIEAINRRDEMKKIREYNPDEEKTKLMSRNVTIIGFFYIIVGLILSALGVISIVSGDSSGAISGFSNIMGGGVTIYMAYKLMMLKKWALYLTMLSILFNMAITILLQIYIFAVINLLIGMILYLERKNFR